MVITNKSGISLEMAVWLLHDEYDYVDKENYISATNLMKPIRQILLPPRIPEEKRIIPDVEDRIASALGQTLHAGIEKAWKNGNHKRALKALGYPESVIERVLVNPTPEEIKAVKDPIIVWIEQRAFRNIKGYTIGGKFDMVCDGRITDTKTTSVWTWIYGDKDKDYQLQGSIYRWLNPDKVTEDFIRINFIFTDWNKADAQTRPGYPPRRVMHKDIPLLSLEDTEKWIATKLDMINFYSHAPEAELPECTEEELWMTDPEFKYYSDPSKVGQPGARATKTFRPKDFPSVEAAAQAAAAFQAEKGKGVVVTVPGTPKRCGYCPAFPICTQKDKYFQKDMADD